MKKEFCIPYLQFNIKGHIYLEEDVPFQRGIIVISHGMAEHSGRYDEFATHFASLGYIVYAYDHIAHGQTCGDPNKVGIIDSKDFVEYIIKDIKQVRDKAHEDYPNLPLYLFAHSMGAIVSEGYIEYYPEDFNKVVLSGTSIGGIKYTFLKLITSIIMTFKGKLYYSPLIQKISIGTFDKAFKKDKTNPSWLSANISNVMRFKQDEYCGKQFPVNYYYSIAKSLNKFKKRRNIKKIKAKKILLISGQNDPVSSFGDDIIKLDRLYEKCNIASNYYIIKDLRHETFNEDEDSKKFVYDRISDFFID